MGPDIDRGGYLCIHSLRALIEAWLTLSQRTRNCDRLDRYVRKESIKRFEQLRRLDNSVSKNSPLPLYVMSAFNCNLPCNR